MGAVKQWQLEQAEIDHLSDHIDDLSYEEEDLHDGKGDWEVRQASEFMPCLRCLEQIRPKTLHYWHTSARKAIHAYCVCDC